MASGPLKLIFVRHGESISNKAGRVTGSVNAPLTERGRRQAAKAARELAKTHIDVIYSSPLKRAVSTAKIIAKTQGKVPLIFKSDLRERHHGSWEGKKISNIPEWHKRYELGFKPGGGESPEELYRRVKRLMKLVLKKHRNHTVVIVAHGAVGRMVRIIATGRGPEAAIGMKTMSNAAINRFNIDKI